MTTFNPNKVFALCSSGAFPVQLTDFAASIFSKQINLILDVENSNKIAAFTAGRSLTGHADFIPIGNIVAENNIRSYFFVDNVANKNYFYGLNIREKTGTKSYFEIKTAKISGRHKLSL